MDAKLTHNKAVTAAQAELIKREQTPMRNDFQESKLQTTGKPYGVKGGP